MPGLDLSFGGTSFPRAAEVRALLYDNAVQGLSARFRRLDRLDAFAKCLEYDHLETDWNGKPADQLETISPQALVPYGFVQPSVAEQSVRERRPTAPLRLVPMIIDRFSDLLFSEDRIPDITVEADDDADAFQRAVLEEFGFWSKVYEGRRHGGSMGTSLATVHLKEGRYIFRFHSPKVVADVIWEDRDQLVPAGVLIQYVTLKEFEVVDEATGRPTGEIREVPYCYRRIIDQEWDVVFQEAPIEDGKPPLEMRVDQRASQRHGLGRFPGAWIQNLPNSEEIDGVPDCEGTYQMVDTVDRLNSQANFALLANMDPTLVISRDPKNRKLLGGGPIEKGSRRAIDVGLQGSASYLEISAGGVTAAQALVKDLRQAVLDKAACILPGPEEQAGAQSAKAIEYRYAPMLAKAGRLRVQWGAGIRQIVRVVLDLGRLWSDPARYDGNARPMFDLPPRVIELDPDPENPDVEPERIERPHNPGRGGTVSISWGSFFAPTPMDDQAEVQTLIVGKDGGLIDQETAIRRASSIYGVRDVKGLIRKVLEEQAQRQRQQAEMIAGAGGGLGGLGDESALADQYAEQQAAAPSPPEGPQTPPAGEGGRP